MAWSLMWFSRNGCFLGGEVVLDLVIALLILDSTKRVSLEGVVCVGK